MSDARPTSAIERASGSIWVLALGYFLAYVPYALLTKAISSGSMPGAASVDGLALLPVTTGVSALGMLTFLGMSGLWRRAHRARVLGASVPMPGLATWISGACTALIVITTTLAYTFDGTSIVTMMLLMRGGVLVLAPLVDAASRRRVRWYSWVALAISLGAVAAAVAPSGAELAVAGAAALDAGIYLAAYFGRLRLMSGAAKRDRDANLRFFVEEQLVATPLAMCALAALALLAPGQSGVALTQGARDVLSGPVLGWAIAIGIFSQATGIFGALVLLDARENSFSVPVNRASSVLAGVVATVALAVLLDGAWPSGAEVAGAALVVVAILVLWLGPRLRARTPRIADAS
ncbi:MAG: hypothetical protein M3Y87_02155 [Myxococcota bacterium]|nr:hypothetical protein [Myxococcota bacterium]